MRGTITWRFKVLHLDSDYIRRSYERQEQDSVLTRGGLGVGFSPSDRLAGHNSGHVRTCSQHGRVDLSARTYCDFVLSRNERQMPSWLALDLLEPGLI